VSRRTRRARRHLRRGDAHREPLLLVADDRGDLIEWVQLAARISYRYRSELAPVALSSVLMLAAAILYGNQVPPWWVPLAALPVASGLCWPRIAPLLRPIERGYTVAVAALCGAWLTAATAFGPDTPPLPLLLLVGTVLGGVPWWAHRRRRAKVRVERTLDAWPDITTAIGIPGSRVMSAVVDRWGWRARIGLPPGTTATDLINSTPALESGLGTRPGAVRVEPDPDRADHATIRVLTTDPHDHPIPYPTDDRDERRNVIDPIPLGLFEDTQPVLLRLAHRHGLLGGVAGAGKSGVLNVILAELVACPDVVLWGVDLKGGMELQPWTSCLDRLATTPAAAAALLADAVAVLDARARQMAADGSACGRPPSARPR
jgi:DNA segregation ATPase FtsK/SpoIIIE, S-DNA-T family